MNIPDLSDLAAFLRSNFGADASLDAALMDAHTAILRCEQTKTTVPMPCGNCYVEWIGKTSVLIHSQCKLHVRVIEAMEARKRRMN
jgi:hypothetical protein